MFGITKGYLAKGGARNSALQVKINNPDSPSLQCITDPFEPISVNILTDSAQEYCVVQVIEPVSVSIQTDNPNRFCNVPPEFFMTVQVINNSPNAGTCTIEPPPPVMSVSITTDDTEEYCTVK